MVVPTCNTNTLETDAGGSQAQPGQPSESLSQNKKYKGWAVWSPAKAALCQALAYPVNESQTNNALSPGPCFQFIIWLPIHTTLSPIAQTRSSNLLPRHSFFNHEWSVV